MAPRKTCPKGRFCPKGSFGPKGRKGPKGGVPQGVLPSEVFYYSEVTETILLISGIRHVIRQSSTC